MGLATTGLASQGTPPGAPGGGGGGPANAMRPVALTPQAGFALAGVAGNILTWTAPADAQQHVVNVGVAQNTTVASTGGRIDLTFTLNGTLFTITAFMAAGPGIGQRGNSVSIEVDPGTTVTILQQSALTAGTSTVWGVITADHA